MATIGLQKFYYAIMEDDTTSGTTYKTPVRIPGLMTANITPGSNTSTLYADDAPFEVASSLGEITVEIGLANLTPQEQAVLLGHEYKDGKLICANSDTAPYVAILFEAAHSDGKRKFVKLLKGKFSEPEENLETNGESVNFSTPTITGAFAARVSDGQWKIVGDEQDANFTSAMADAWYTSVDPSASP